jgi:hypothetical protein
MRKIIDLSYKPVETKQKDDEPPMIVELLLLSPYALLLWAVLTKAFLHGIF